MKPIQLTIITLFALALMGCGNDQQVSSGEWLLTYDNGVTIKYGATTLAHGLTSEYSLGGRTVSSQDYDTRQFAFETINDEFGLGKRWTVTFTDDHLPTLVQHFSLYPAYLLTDISISADSSLATNYMAPLVVPATDSVISGRQLHHLFVPFDNDAWIRYSAPADIPDGLRSYEVSAAYNADSRSGLVIGAIDHDLWKNAIDLGTDARRLTAFSGVADSLTRDHHAHGTITASQVRSARFMMGLFADWRDGLEAYAHANAVVTPPRHWDKAMPVGWNSWGALAFKVNHDNSTRISDFFASELQPHSFGNADGQLYTGLDSGWNNFTEEELRDFADRCRRNNQVPCIYWTPFTDWGKNAERQVPGVEEYKYKDLYLYADGQPQELDGAYALDPTHPAVRRMMEQTHDLFRRCGYEYVKMDFMTHGRMEADGWYRASVTTGTQAYNYGMHLLDSIFSDMYLNLSISPIFPSQYAQSRRIACDAWNKMKDTEYTMNALSWGWWIDDVYCYNDADHVVLRDATEGENRARITSSVITGLYITGDDFSADTMAIRRAKHFLTNPDINRLATGRSFRPLSGHDAQADHTFIRTDADGTIYLAVFNYGDEPLSFVFDRQQLQLHVQGAYDVVELWSHQRATLDEPQVIVPKDVKVFRLQRI